MSRRMPMTPIARPSGPRRAEALRLVGMTSPPALRGFRTTFRITPRSTTSRSAAVNSRVSSGVIKRESDCSRTSSWRNPSSWETASLACRIFPSRSETNTGSGALAMMMSASSEPRDLRSLPSPLIMAVCVPNLCGLAILDLPHDHKIRWRPFRSHPDLARGAANLGTADTVPMRADLAGSSRQAVTSSIHGRAAVLIGATNHLGTPKSANALRDLAIPLSSLLTPAMKDTAPSSTLVVKKMRYTLAPEIAEIVPGDRPESRLSRTSLKTYSVAWFDWVARLYIQGKNCQEKSGVGNHDGYNLVVLMTLTSARGFLRFCRTGCSLL